LDWRSHGAAVGTAPALGGCAAFRQVQSCPLEDPSYLPRSECEPVCPPRDPRAQPLPGPCDARTLPHHQHQALQSRNLWSCCTASRSPGSPASWTALEQRRQVSGAAPLPHRLRGCPDHRRAGEPGQRSAQRGPSWVSSKRAFLPASSSIWSWYVPPSRAAVMVTSVLAFSGRGMRLS
jgi:hypothetical protein